MQKKLDNASDLCHNSNIVFGRIRRAMEFHENLINKAKLLDSSALDEIFVYFKPFIRSVAFKYFLSGADREDLIQEGMIGLFNAIRNYDSEKGISFEIFAKHCIVLRLKTAVKNSLRKKHSPLNDSVSLEADEVLSKSLKTQGPEDLFFDHEDFKIANEKLKVILSKFELSVLYLVNSGMTYKEIANVLGKSPKSIDNALQRIKKKAAPLFNL